MRGHLSGEDRQGAADEAHGPVRVTTGATVLDQLRDPPDFRD
jgi:hypothetical protein